MCREMGGVGLGRGGGSRVGIPAINTSGTFSNPSCLYITTVGYMACDNILVMHPLLKHFDHFQNECVGPVLAATVISSILGTSYSIDGFKLQLNTMIEDSTDAVSTLIAPLSINKAELKPDHSWQPIARRLVDDPSLLILGEPEVVYANNRSLHRRTLLKELYETPADKPTLITIGKDKNEIPNGAISTLIFFSFYGLVRYLSKVKDEFLDRFIMLHESVVAPTKTELTLVEPQELTDWIATAKTLNRTLSQSRASIEIEWLPNARIVFDHLLDKELSTTLNVDGFNQCLFLGHGFGALVYDFLGGQVVIAFDFRIGALNFTICFCFSQLNFTAAGPEDVGKCCGGGYCRKPCGESAFD